VIVLRKVIALPPSIVDRFARFYTAVRRHDATGL
jgi:hypothetical protein